MVVYFRLIMLESTLSLLINAQSLETQLLLEVVALYIPLLLQVTQKFTSQGQLH
jgi:hypothetical protein